MAPINPRDDVEADGMCKVNSEEGKQLPDGRWVLGTRFLVPDWLHNAFIRAPTQIN